MKTENRRRRLKALRAKMVVPPAQKRGWTKEELIAELKRVAKLLGHAPTQLAFDEHASMSCGTVAYNFGTYNKGLKVAGLEPNYRRDISKSECITELQRVAKKLGHSLTMAGFNKEGSISAGTIQSSFGSWNAGLSAAGLRVNSRYDITKSECITELQRVAKKLGHVPTMPEFTKHANMSRQPVVSNFGTYNKGLKAAGLEPNYRQDISKSECITELQRVAKKLDHVPTIAEFSKHASMSYQTVANNFGTYNKGLKAAGLEPRPQGVNL